MATGPIVSDDALLDGVAVRDTQAGEPSVWRPHAGHLGRGGARTATAGRRPTGVGRRSTPYPRWIVMARRAVDPAAVALAAAGTRPARSMACRPPGREADRPRRAAGQGAQSLGGARFVRGAGGGVRGDRRAARLSCQLRQRRHRSSDVTGDVTGDLAGPSAPDNLGATQIAGHYASWHLREPRHTPPALPICRHLASGP